MRTARRDAAGVHVLSGPTILSDLGPALDDLHAATATPLTARRPWLETWVACYSDHEPWGAVVEARSGRLRAAALLARRRRIGVTEVVALGYGPSDQNRLPATDPAAAEAVAEAVVRGLAALRTPWLLRLEQLPVDDPVASAVAARLPGSALVDGDGSPTVRFGLARSFRAHASRNAWQSERRMWNRVRRDGREVEVAHLRDPEAVAAVLPEVEAIHRERDLILRGRSDLEDERALDFWRAVLQKLARRGELELSILRLDGALAAYVACLLDGPSYRMWDGRFSAGWSRYAPGLLVNFAALRRAMEDPRFEEFDWMRGVEPYKLRTANEIVPARHLMAWSSTAVRVAAGAARSAKRTVGLTREFGKGHPAGAWSGRFGSGRRAGRLPPVR